MWHTYILEQRILKFKTNLVETLMGLHLNAKVVKVHVGLFARDESVSNTLCSGG